MEIIVVRFPCEIVWNSGCGGADADSVSKSSCLFVGCASNSLSYTALVVAWRLTMTMPCLRFGA